MTTSGILKGEIPYPPDQIKILSAIQEASMGAALPIIISIFKHLSAQPELVDRNTVKNDILNDPDLKDSLKGSEIKLDAIGLDNTIKILISQNIFLKSEDDKIGLTEKGMDAAELFGLI
jgi:hypothetical protein